MLSEYRPSTKLCPSCKGLGGFPPSIMHNGGQCPRCKGFGVVDNNPFPTNEIPNLREGKQC